MEQRYSTLMQGKDPLENILNNSKSDVVDLPIEKISASVDNGLVSDKRNNYKQKCKVLVSRKDSTKFIEMVNKRTTLLRKKIVEKLEAIYKEAKTFLTESENDAKKDSQSLKKTYDDNKASLIKTNNETVVKMKESFLKSVNKIVSTMKTTIATFSDAIDVDEVTKLIETSTTITDKFNKDLKDVITEFKNKEKEQTAQFEKILNELEKTYEKGLASIIAESNKKRSSMRIEQNKAKEQLEKLYKDKIKEEIDITEANIRVKLWIGGGFFTEAGEYFDGILAHALPSKNSVRISANVKGVFQNYIIPLDEICIEEI